MNSSALLNLFVLLLALHALDCKSAGQPAQRSLTFDPVVAGRTYTVTSKPDLNDPAWIAISVSPPTDNGTARTVTDANATGDIKFYRIEITKP